MTESNQPNTYGKYICLNCNRYEGNSKKEGTYTIYKTKTVLKLECRRCGTLRYLEIIPKITCPICKEEFTSLLNLNTHIQLNHKNGDKK